MSAIITIEDFISRSGEIPMIDVRSESEFKQGNFPGAVNIPILNDEMRKEVGITYKQKGRHEAVIKGFDLAGGKFGDFIREAKTLTEQSSGQHPVLLIYCWRGGMRSAIADWILSLSGFQVFRLKGGYKTFRKWTQETLKQEKNILVLGGMTGSGKTEILGHLSALGETVIDLEKIAHHKGSAFGGLGQLPQPSNEHFENMLALEWAKIPNVPVSGHQRSFAWLENESRTIGHNQLPNAVYEQIRLAPVVEIKVSSEMRLERILSEYGRFPVDQLAEMTRKLKKRLGGQHLKESLEYLVNSDLKNWAGKMLGYYDKAYSYGMSQRSPGSIYPVILNGTDHFELAKQVKLMGHAVMKKTGKKELSL